MSNNTLLDILLFPKAFFEKITDKLHSLYLGIILIGFIDMGFVLSTKLSQYFFAKQQSVLIFNITLALCFVVLIGLVDVIFFALPLFDIFKFFRVKERIKNINGQLIKLMKIYIASHFLVVPVNAFFYWLAVGDDKTGTSMGITSFLVLMVITPLWHSAIISRGINTIYSFDERLKSLVFLIVYAWTVLLGYALSFITDNWLVVLLR